MDKGSASAPAPGEPRDVAVASSPHQADLRSTPRVAANATDGHDLSTLTAKIGELGIESAAQTAPAETSTDNNSPIPVREIREAGEPFDDVQFCPGPRIVTHALTWSYITDMPEAAGAATLTCSRCYQDYIEPTPLAAEWSSAVLGEGSALMCCFHMPRVKQIMWPKALRSGGMLELRAFLARTAALAPCPGGEPTTGVAGSAWYGLPGGDIPGFTACEFCYEMYVAGTGFDARFAQFEEPAEEHTWTCHIRGDTVGRIAAHMAERGGDDWEGFIAASSERLRLPECAREEPVPSDSRGWYLARGAMRSAPVCATCYRDSLATTQFADRFRRYSPQRDRFPSPGPWTCSLAGALPPLMALEAALQQHDFDAFAAVMQNIRAAPRCAQGGIVDGQWWTLAGGGCPSFAVCYACFAGIFWMRALDGFLQPAEAPPGESLVCSFHPSHPRFGQYWAKLHEAIDRGVFGYLAEHVRRVSETRVCARNGALAGARWWGYPESRFCEDCFVTFVRDTRLGECLPLDGVVVEDEATFCQIWSPRMRQRWLDACEAGEPGSAASAAAVDEFRAVSKSRCETYFKTLSEIELMKQLKGVQRQQALFSAQLSIRYQGMHGLSTMFSTPEYKYGNSSIGWYGSSYGAESRVLFDKFTTGLAESQFNASEIQRILALQKIWSEVE